MLVDLLSTNRALAVLRICRRRPPPVLVTLRRTETSNRQGGHSAGYTVTNISLYKLYVTYKLAALTGPVDDVPPETQTCSPPPFLAQPGKR